MSKININKVDVEKMSATTGISYKEIIFTLGLNSNEQCKATTWTKAREIYNDTADSSIEEAAALKKMAELATTLSQTGETYNLSEDNSEAKFIAFKKHNDLILKKLGKARSWKSAKNLYFQALDNSEAKVAALIKMATFFIKK